MKVIEQETTMWVGLRQQCELDYVTIFYAERSLLCTSLETVSYDHIHYGWKVAKAGAHLVTVAVPRWLTAAQVQCQSSWFVCNRTRNWTVLGWNWKYTTKRSKHTCIQTTVVSCHSTGIITPVPINMITATRFNRCSTANKQLTNIFGAWLVSWLAWWSQHNLWTNMNFCHTTPIYHSSMKCYVLYMVTTHVQHAHASEIFRHKVSVWCIDISSNIRHCTGTHSDAPRGNWSGLTNSLKKS